MLVVVVVEEDVVVGKLLLVEKIEGSLVVPEVVVFKIVSFDVISFDIDSFEVVSFGVDAFHVDVIIFFVEINSVDLGIVWEFVVKNGFFVENFDVIFWDVNIDRIGFDVSRFAFFDVIGIVKSMPVLEVKLVGLSVENSE